MTEVIWMPGGLRTEIRLTGEQTGGAFTLLVDEPPPGWALPPHRHANESETIVIVEGEFTMDVGGVASRLGPGDSVHVPAGTLHSGGNAGQTTGRRAVLFSPSGLEAFFREVGLASPDDPVDVQAAVEAAARHGWRF